MNKKEISFKAIDEVYRYYEANHSLTMSVFLRFNGEAQYPGEMLSKEQFIEKISLGYGEWFTAYDVLYMHMLKEFKIENNDLDN